MFNGQWVPQGTKILHAKSHGQKKERKIAYNSACLIELF